MKEDSLYFFSEWNVDNVLINQKMSGEDVCLFMNGHTWAVNVWHHFNFRLTVRVEYH